MQPVDLEDVAIVGRPKTDNVAVVAVDFLEQGTQLRYLDGVITMSRRAQRGQSFAVRPVQQGQPYITLGDPFGIASRTMQAGDPIEEENLALELPDSRFFIATILPRQPCPNWPCAPLTDMYATTAVSEPETTWEL